MDPRVIKNRCRGLFPVLLMPVTAAVLVLLLAPDAYASSQLSGDGFGSETVNIGRIIQRLGFAGGALGLAWSGIEYAVGNGQKADKARSRMIMIGVAIAALILLPTVINMALGMFAASGWTP